MILVNPEHQYLLELYNYSINGRGYANRRLGNKRILLHREIMKCPDGMTVDHINRNKLDNRTCNLRICTKAENSRNCKIRSDNTTGYKGVYFWKYRNKYRAVIKVDGKRKFLGLFATAVEASEAYKQAAAEYHKEFASY